MTDLNDLIYTDGVHDVLAVYVNRLLAATLRSEYKNLETLTADRELTDADTPIQRFDCGAANRVVKVPAGDAVENHPFFLVNASAVARTLTVKNNAGSVGLATLTQGQAVLMLPDGNGGYLSSSTDLSLYLLSSGLSDWDQQSSSPSSPAAGKMKLFFKNDEKLYKRNPSGTETEIGAGGGVTSGPQAFGDNYVITPSISTNNLVVALKTIAGTDASAFDKMPFRIGNAKRELTSALSLTVNASSSVFNLGSAELAALKQQLFVYVGWRAASSTIFLGLSRIPWGATYADFSATPTDEKYLAYTGSAPASTDVVEVIGRIDVQNSGSASYNWSLPAGAVVINRPIYETDPLEWTPTRTGYSSNPTSTIYRYRFEMRTVTIYGRDGATGASNANTNYLSLPFSALAITNMAYQFMAAATDNGVDLTTPSYGAVYSGSSWNTIHVSKTVASAITDWTTSGNKRIRTITGFYIAA